MSKNRATQAELIARRQEIQRLILAGVTGIDIQNTMSEKWKTSKRAIAEDIRQISKDWQEKEPTQTQLMKNKYMARLEMLLNEALQEKHIKTALEIQKEIHKLNGLYNDNNEKEVEMPKFVKVSRKNKLKVVGDDDSE